MKANPSRRAGKVANRRVQYALVGRVLTHWIFFTVATCIFLLISYALFGREPGQSLGQFFSGYAKEVLPLLVVSVFLLPIFLVDINKVSHRFAGPMVRFRRGLKEVAQGDQVQEMSFRPGDFWQDMATDFNKAIAQIDGQSNDDTTNDKEDSREPVTVG